MLQQSLLTTYTLNGQLQTVPVLATVTAMHPIPQGLLLSVSFVDIHVATAMQDELFTQMLSLQQAEVLCGTRKVVVLCKAE